MSEWWMLPRLECPKPIQFARMDIDPTPMDCKTMARSLVKSPDSMAALIREVLRFPRPTAKHESLRQMTRLARWRWPEHPRIENLATILGVRND
jgi:hypothetical protein